MRTIQTKYIGPSNVRGSRIKAWVADEPKMQATIPYDHAMDNFHCHLKAAKALADKINWHGSYIAGSTKNGYVFVNIETRIETL